MGIKAEALERELIDLIQSGLALEKGNRFMSERLICEKFNVSRTTVRSAISNLCKQGYLVQIHGKGTFLKQNSHSIFSVTRCLKNYGELGFSPSCQVLSKQVLPAPKQVATQLDISEGDSVLYLLIRYQADRMIFNITESYLPLPRFPGIELTDFRTAPLLSVLKAQYGAQATITENIVGRQ